MSLKEIKRQLAIDQENIRSGRVVSINQDITRVRLRTGVIVQAQGGLDFQAGDQVLLHTDGRSWSIAGSAPLASLDGEIIKHV